MLGRIVSDLSRTQLLNTLLLGLQAVAEPLADSPVEIEPVSMPIFADLSSAPLIAGYASLDTSGQLLTAGLPCVGVHAFEANAAFYCQLLVAGRHHWCLCGPGFYPGGA